MRYFFSTYIRKARKHTTLLTMLTLAVVVLSIPLTVMILQTNEDIRQQAAERGTNVQSEPVSVQAWTDNKKNGRIPGRILVRFKTTVQSSNALSVSATENRIKKKFKASVSRNDKLGIRVIKVKPGQEQQVISALSQDPTVDSVEQSSYVYVADTPNDPDFKQQWGMQKVQLPAAWNVTQGKDSVVIAILDTGIDENHPDLKDKILTSKSTNMVKVPNGQETDQDKYGHGTHVAGIAAAITNNNEGVAGGCPNCKLMNVKVMPDSGQDGQDTDVAEGIKYAVDNGANIINMSLSGPNPMDVINKQIDYAVSKGVLVVVAAGNTGSSAPAYPASYDKAIAVGATDQNGNKASFSNYGNWVDIAAPGTGIVSTLPTYSFGLQKNKAGLSTKYGALDGTSMAAPLVSGIAGLMMSQGMSADQVRQTLLSSTDTIQGRTFAHGVVNAASALGGKSGNQPNNPTPSDKPPKAKPSRTPKDSTTPAPCTTPPDQSGNGRTPKPSKTPNSKQSGSPDNSPNGKQTKTPDKKASKDSTKQHQSLLEKLLALRAKFLGGAGGGRTGAGQQNNTNQRSGSNGQQNSITKQGAGQNGQENISNHGGTIHIQSLDTAKKDPCNPANNQPDPNNPNGRTPRPSRTPNQGNQGGSGTPGHQDVITQPGEQKVVITQTQEIVPPQIIINGTPQAGSANSASVTILDYNFIVDCYSDVVPPRDCSPEKKAQADLNHDGDVNQLDYNIFLKQIAAQK